jgi:hypothetical protein
MYQRMSEELARHRLAEVQGLMAGRGNRPTPPVRGASGQAVSALPAATSKARMSTARMQQARMSPRSTSRARVTLQSLRMRAGWRLVDVGLKLAVTSDSRGAAAPRPAGS